MYLINKEILKKNRYKTAIKRNVMSKPLRLAIKAGIVTFDRSIHDYGCGRGDDWKNLLYKGYFATGHDTSGEKRAADVVMLTYVINTIEDQDERYKVLQDAYYLANKYLVVSVRGDRNTLKDAKPFGDGLVTKRGTFQKFYTNDELQFYIYDVLGTLVKKLANNIVVIKKDLQ